MSREKFDKEPKLKGIPSDTPEEKEIKKEIENAIKTGGVEIEKEKKDIEEPREEIRVKLPVEKDEKPSPQKGDLKGLFGGVAKIKKVKEEIPSVDDSLETLAKEIVSTIKTPKQEEKKEKTQKEGKIPEWEIMVGEWIESKIRREMDKKHLGRRDAEENLKIKLKETLPRIFRNFAVHEIPKHPKETDLDGRVCLGLLHLAGWRTDKGNKVAYIDYDKRLRNRVHMDVGQYGGVAFLRYIDGALEPIALSEKDKIKEEVKRHQKLPFRNLGLSGLIIDHHPEGEPSAAGMIFRLLDKLRMFEQNKNLDRKDYLAIRRMIEFVDLVDSQGIQEVGKSENWNKSDRTILGLYRYMKFSELLKFFREDGGFNRELTDEELAKYELIYRAEKYGKFKTINRQKERRMVIDNSKEQLRDFTERGFVIDTKFGKIVIDTGGNLFGGATAAQSIGAGYLKWNEKEKTLFMFSDKDLDQDLFDKGFRARKRLWLIPEDTKDSGLTLNKVIEKIGGRVIPGSDLEKYLK